jgi:UDP-N-acetylmuramoyl-tripeptide--D-alanyl-D-alanine ligase
VRLPASEVAAATGGTLHGDDVVVDGASIDSRTLRAGQLFVPISASRDGHGFIPAAREAGAAAYLTAQPPVGGTAVVVDDTTVALGELAHDVRRRLPLRATVAITGSVGKTTVKDLARAALGTTFRVAASERSFNNELGVPLTLLNAPGDSEVAVIEMGARGAGHIQLLCEVARPTIGVVTRVAMAHTALFGSLDDVATAKGELVEALPPEGTAVLNGDDERVRAMASRTRATVLLFGQGGGVDVRASSVMLDDLLRPSFVLESPAGRIPVRAPVAGRHQVANILAAAAAAIATGADLEAIAAGLAEASVSPWRMELQRTASGALVVNDAYNANPTSTEAALRALADLPGSGRRVAVLGVMAELGRIGEDEHRRIAQVARSLDVLVVAVDAPAYGLPVVDGEDGALAAVAALGALGEGDAILVKGSRVAGLERVAAALAGPAPAAG